MIIYKGFGWLVAVTAIVGIVIAGALGFRHPAMVWGILGLTGIADHFIGKKLNGQDGRLVQDVATGEVLELKNTHSFFWIPMQHWLWVKLVLCGIFVVLGTYWRNEAA